MIIRDRLINTFVPFHPPIVEYPPCRNQRDARSKTRKKPDNYKRTTADLRALVRFSFCLFFLKNGRLCEKHCIMSGYNLFGHTDNCYQITVKPVKHIGPCVSVCIRNVALTEYRNCFLSTMAGAALTSSRIKNTELQTQFD